jgi:DNA modification methylase
MNNPKLSPGRGNWYRYYAGFSLDFAKDVVESLELPRGSHILDPWSGSGTTVLASIENRHRSTGIDANPALVVVGRGRLLPVEVANSLVSLANGILEMARESDALIRDDPLEQWFHCNTAMRLRRIEWAIQHLLVSHEEYRPLSHRANLADVSSLAAFFYVALFEVVRALASTFRGSNPTWMKPAAQNMTVRATWRMLEGHFLANVSRLSGALPTSTEGAVRARVQTGTSVKLPLAADSVDGVVTSPPYCTRIDYVVSTLPELAVMGYDRTSARIIRDQMIGTPTIHDSSIDIPSEWGPEVTQVLTRIRNHDSRASKQYYFKTYRQYFAGMAKSFDEIGRVLRSGGRVVMVAQDSFYKEMHVDLPGLLANMAVARGWSMEKRTDFTSRRGLAQLNPGARHYRTNFSTVESVLVLTV